MDRKSQNDISRKLKVLRYAEEIGNISKACRYFGICRETFYTWRRAYIAQGEAGLINNKPCPENHKLRTPRPIEEKVIYLRQHYHFGPDMIVWHLERYHGIKLSRNGCYNILVRNKLNRLPENIKLRSRSKFKRYEKKGPWPGHEFQTKFHWHAADIGLQHTYIKPATPRLNGKVERSHLTDKREFYKCLEVDLNKKLAQWESYYNFLRPDAAHLGKTLYEKLRVSMLG